MTPRALMALCREKGVQCVEIRYMCLNGSIEYFHLPADRLSEELFEVGLPFASNQRHVHASASAALVPLADTFYLAPFRTQTTLVLLAESQDAVTRRDDDFDPRGILQRATEAWMSTGLCDKVMVGQTCEVLLLRSLNSRVSDRSSEIRFEPLSAGNGDFVRVESGKDQYSDSASKPSSSFTSADDVAMFCGEVLQHLSEAGIEVEYASNSGLNAGHCRFQLTAVEAVKAADIHLLTCDIIRSTASRYGVIACFLPAISRRDPVLGWDLRLAFTKSSESLITGSKHFGLSDKGLAIAAGLVKHFGSCLAFTNRSELSFRRLCELMKNKRTDGTDRLHPFIKVVASTSQLTDRTLELGFCDQTSNPYLAIASVLMASLHGLEENMSLDASGKVVANKFDRDGEVPSRIPTTLERALVRARSDQDFLTAHDVFSPEVLKTWRRCVSKEKTLANDDLFLPAEFLARYRG